MFQKRPRKSIDINFSIGNEPTGIIQEYTYLGHVYLQRERLLLHSFT